MTPNIVPVSYTTSSGMWLIIMGSYLYMNITTWL